MELKEALKMCEAQIKDFEKALFHYESIVRPRAEADKKILDNLREQYTKLEALQEKLDRGEELTKEEIYNSVPNSLRIN